MMVRRTMLVMLSVLTLSPLTAAQGTGEVTVPPVPPVPPLMAPCQYNMAGDRVGYDASGGFGHTHLGLGVHVAHDLNYLATGVFLGGVIETHDGAEFLVFTIVTGFSERADWCDRIVDSAGLGHLFYEEDG